VDFLLTCDVESFSIPLNRCDNDTAHQVYKQGLPRVLELCAKHDIPATFYFTGELAEIVPEAIDLVKDHGHEIGCHGYYHDVDRTFDLLTLDQQVRDLTNAKKIIESVAGKIVSFRAPALRINEDLVKALTITGFETDSSICPQRFDGPFTFGSTKKLSWLTAPRQPNYLDKNKSVLEIPISALLIPYIGTTMRIAPNIIKILEKTLFFESKLTDKPLVFLFHPNECIDTSNLITRTRRTKNFFHYLFADVLRQQMKLKNLGPSSIRLLDKILTSAQQSGFEFVSAKEFNDNFKNKNKDFQ
jgi:peptidoglycan-N-acetylglucosamine deacetylase